MATAKDLYTNILPHAMGAFAAKTADLESAKQMAHALTNECVSECARLGLLEDMQQEVRPYGLAPADTAPARGNGPQGLATFAETQSQGSGPQGIAPIGQPYQPVPHYNVASAPAAAQPAAPPPPTATPWYPPHLAYMHQPPAAAPQPIGTPQAKVATGEGTVASQMQPYDVGGMKVVPPTGQTFVPPAQAGVMNNVVQVPTPKGYSALGTDGVIVQPSQRPNNQDMVVAPGNQPVITQAGGAGTMFVPEKIVH